MVFEGYLLEGLVMRDVAVAACVFALLFEVDLVEPCRADAVAVCTAHTLAASQCIVAHRIYRGVRTGESYAVITHRIDLFRLQRGSAVRTNRKRACDT
jgi:hypothetical protein